MNFERYCGMASAAALLLILSIASATGIWGPLWQRMSTSDGVTVAVGVIGWIIAIGAGTIAFVLSQQQIRLARTQLDLQQHQIHETQADIAQATFLRVNGDVDKLGDDVERLKTARADLNKLIERFPDPGKLDGWTNSLLTARSEGEDVLSPSASAAPFGYGDRILATVTRLQRMGDVISERELTMPSQLAVAFRFDASVKRAIMELRTLSSQIKDEIPKREHEIARLGDRRNALADQARAADRRAGRSKVL
ncbi:hypothetical protein [Bradyrhizobium sp. ORS 285]|uniref:hypothetical protein n=1 Tax=Bradyrhizobium sp. ORS 285 TaxID=115808 RepID=UPI0002407321|nr:hypothetical protein [Bradyrhizobium sp. ORS 285]CCD86703.1 exported hypothetical protein [Bradyrhizobium sp. ORS 285]